MELQFIPLYDDDLKCRKIKVMAVNDKGETRDVGFIFTPSSSGENIKDAIQVCGFKDAFDLWGCARYVHTFVKDGVILEHDKFTRAKDIQLHYVWETFKKDIDSLDGICHRCYNEDCTCEVKIEHENPYTVCRENDLQWLDRKEKDKK